ncbi:hypothetical protein SAICODRAFT_111390 [Saitoella complicata NRRL Y-17804]|uniref:uncharacterized protein n=1 Tax=Saitoella complicata (strain BCRC 22490 / CBS 7301 / JCM 7358 / NBRC 10748 / NRRL Y-17804) TaxID=698492 RepID=UPI00086775E3|nr:uncharacterized protein SAICODRAFT_111390 [Saitoella complicata NRRL Y-17804]ODQ56600.1 hypothetical protein SAICODRAFT_111390 [Saitoella complicata NRRL Y-17804]
MSQRTTTRRRTPILWWGLGIAAATAVGVATWWIASRAAGAGDPESSPRAEESDRSARRKGKKKKMVVIVIQDVRSPFLPLPLSRCLSNGILITRPQQEEALNHIPPILHPHTSDLLLLAPHTLPSTSLAHAQTLLPSPHNLIQYQNKTGAGVPSIIRHLGPDVVVFLGGGGEWVEEVKQWVGRVVVVDEEGEGGRRGNVEVVKAWPGDGEEGVGWWMARV